MKEFHSRGKLSKQIGASFIALIPIKSDFRSIKNFRHINLIGCIYKILAKVLVGRLQKVLHHLLSHSQDASVWGRDLRWDSYRQWVNSIFIQDMETKDQTCFVSWISRTLTTVNWGSFNICCEKLVLLLHRGDGSKCVCVNQARFSILINGSLKSFPLAQRGLCQCNPYPLSFS